MLLSSILLLEISKNHLMLLAKLQIIYQHSLPLYKAKTLHKLLKGREHTAVTPVLLFCLFNIYTSLPLYKAKNLYKLLKGRGLPAARQSYFFALLIYILACRCTKQKHCTNFSKAEGIRRHAG